MPSKYRRVATAPLSPELTAWRATATATDLPGLMRNLAAQLHGRTGASALYLRQLRSEPARLETVGVVQLGGVPSPARNRSPLREGQGHKVVAFCLSGALQHFVPGQAEAWVEAAVPDGVGVPCLLGPLAG